MTRRFMPLLLLTLVMVLAACASGSEEPAATEAPPAEATPEVEAETATPEPTPTLTPTFVRPTLQPTWTPTPMNTPTLLPEEVAATEASAPTVPPPATIDPACGTFGPDRAVMDTEFLLGESPTIAWTPVEGAALYRVLIYDQNGFQVHSELVEETSVDVNPDVFTVAGPYGWDVEPLDGFGIQMCIGRGDMLLARSL